MTEPQTVKFEAGEPIRVYVPSADALPAIGHAERIATLAGDVGDLVRTLDTAAHLPGGDWCDGLGELAYQLGRIKRALREALDATPERIEARRRLRELRNGGMPALDLESDESEESTYVTPDVAAQ